MTFNKAFIPSLMSRIALATTAAFVPAAAFASQGPGAGPGTASPTMQFAMAVIVYGGSALIVAAGLVGAVRQHR